MKCPICGKEHNEWHGKEICFICASNELIKSIKKIDKKITKMRDKNV